MIITKLDQDKVHFYRILNAYFDICTTITQVPCIKFNSIDCEMLCSSIRNTHDIHITSYTITDREFEVASRIKFELTYHFCLECFSRTS